jgi:hypothetical protein
VSVRTFGIVAFTVALASAPTIAQAEERVRDSSDAEAPSHADVEKQRRRAGIGGAFLVLGVGASAAASTLGYLSLAPKCTDPANPMTCDVPDSTDIQRRAGMLAGGAGLSFAAALMAGLGTRGLVRNTGNDLSLAARTRRRHALVGAGATAIVLGTAGLVAGSALVGVGASRLASSRAPTIDPTDPAGSQQNVMNDVAARLEGLRVARTGLAVALAAPTMLAIGIALVRNRNHAERRETVTLVPSLSPRFAGATLKARF